MIEAAEELAETTGVEPACRALGVVRSSLYRSRRPPPKRRAARPRPHHRALTPLEKQRVLSYLHEERFVDQAPASIYATLLEEGPSTLPRKFSVGCDEDGRPHHG